MIKNKMYLNVFTRVLIHIESAALVFNNYEILMIIVLANLTQYRNMLYSAILFLHKTAAVVLLGNWSGA